jgi:hypothetical protein
MGRAYIAFGRYRESLDASHVDPSAIELSVEEKEIDEAL